MCATGEGWAINRRYRGYGNERIIIHIESLIDNVGPVVARMPSRL
ncbi:hypothetical protein [Dyella monticola]|nr:hypothetical protein [Dyella monticola]